MAGNNTPLPGSVIVSDEEIDGAKVQHVKFMLGALGVNGGVVGAPGVAMPT